MTFGKDFEGLAFTTIVCTPSLRTWCAMSGTVSVPSTGWPPVIATASL